MLDTSESLAVDYSLNHEGRYLRTSVLVKNEIMKCLDNRVSYQLSQCDQIPRIYDAAEHHNRQQSYQRPLYIRI